ncbi:MAG: GrpE protein, molecular chaperone GrpE [Parcubacteria group bacterium GW2011_GWC1_41_7]|nr:MAG: GrpE protein, molecular chaperone GrpE [Parcubacteria group bacterium GW2011_GWC1_41_7]
MDEEKKMQEEENSEEELPTTEESMKEFDSALSKAEKERDEYLAGWKRAKADLLNAQKETEQKMKQFAYFANANLIADLLPVLDSFDMALHTFEEKDKDSAMGRGYVLVQTQMFDLLRRYGLEVIDPKGKEFDPKIHEAIDTKQCETSGCDGSDEGLNYYGKDIRNRFGNYKFSKRNC